MAYSDDRRTVGATRARQGRLGRSVFWVLVFAIALTVLGFAATWAWKAGGVVAQEPNPGAQRSAEVGTFNAPQPRAVMRQNYQNGAPLAPQNGGNPTNPPKPRS